MNLFNATAGLEMAPVEFWFDCSVFCYRTNLFTELIYERERGRYFDKRPLWEIQSLYAPILPPFCGVSCTQNLWNALVCCLTTGFHLEAN